MFIVIILFAHCWGDLLTNKSVYRIWRLHRKQSSKPLWLRSHIIRMFDVFAMSGNFFTVSALILAMTTTINNSSQVKLCKSLLWREITVFTRCKLRLKLLNEIYKKIWPTADKDVESMTPFRHLLQRSIVFSSRFQTDQLLMMRTVKAQSRHATENTACAHKRSKRDFPSSKFMTDYFGQNSLTFKHDNQTCPHQIALTVLQNSACKCYKIGVRDVLAVCGYKYGVI